MINYSNMTNDDLITTIETLEIQRESDLDRDTTGELYHIIYESYQKHFDRIYDELESRELELEYRSVLY